MTTGLLEILWALEAELIRPLGRRDRDRLDALLHRDFREVGLSGRIYSRSDVLEVLPAETALRRIAGLDMAVTALTPDVALLTYRSSEAGPDGSASRQAHRSSLWVRDGDRWTLLHHQATPAAMS